MYVKYFGENKGDSCFVAEVNNKIVGAVWVRIMNDYGHIDNETPSLEISLLKDLFHILVNKEEEYSLISVKQVIE